ncbi:hypothetical protein KKF97_00905 [Myxococcota bacterium]|nr:hypothetical protein [Myxococcota bacterium]
MALLLKYSRNALLSSLKIKENSRWSIFSREMLNLLPEWAAITWLLLLRAGIQGFGCFASLTHWLFQDKESFGSQHIFPSKK